MNKMERKIQQTNRHIENLEKLSELCGIPGADGRVLLRKLRRLELKASRLMADYCNGDRDSFQSNDDRKEIYAKVQKLFKGNLTGLIINTDPRGYTLKIDDEINRTVYKEINLHRDLGGYGILAPEITGN